MSRPRPGAWMAAIVAGITVLLSEAPAEAADYRYWTLWNGTADGGWEFALTGARDIAVMDGSVIGWHFAVAPADGAPPPTSVATADFAELCPDLSTPADGQDRVAIVVDHGDPAVAPAGEQPPPSRVSCLTVEQGLSALEATRLASPAFREDAGLVCGIDGYPATECGVEVDATALAQASGSEGPAVSPWPWVIGAVAIAVSLLLIVLALAQRARRR